MRENNTTCLLIQFQVNSLDEKKVESFNNVMEAMVRGLKVSPVVQDKDEYKKYLKFLVEKGFTRYFSE